MTNPTPQHRPVDLHSEYLRADLFLAVDQPVEAARVLVPLVEAEPANEAALELLARSYFRSAQLARAEETLTRLGLGGRIASGRQWTSWLHVEDWLAIARWALGLDERAAPAPSGVLLATSPNPVRNAELMATLRRVLHRPAAPPTPELLVRVGAVLLRTDPALALTGRRAVSARLAEVGFEFRHPHLDEALTDLLRGP